MLEQKYGSDSCEFWVVYRSTKTGFMPNLKPKNSPLSHVVSAFASICDRKVGALPVRSLNVANVAPVLVVVAGDHQQSRDEMLGQSANGPNRASRPGRWALPMHVRRRSRRTVTRVEGLSPYIRKGPSTGTLRSTGGPGKISSTMVYNRAVKAALNGGFSTNGVRQGRADFLGFARYLFFWLVPSSSFLSLSDLFRFLYLYQRNGFF